MSPRQLPSFFKILLDRSSPHLELPPGFVRKHLEKNIPENLILQSRNGGYEWRLKIKKEGDIYCFADGWSDVVEDSELRFGDFLVFWLVDESTFKLSIFSPNGCERDFPSQIRVEHDEIDEEEEKEEEEEEEEGDDDEEEEEEEEEEGEDDEEEEEEDGGGGGDEVEHEGDEDEDGGGDDENPFFTKIISKGQKYTLRFPMDFARVAGINERRSINIKNLEGKEWRMKLLSEGGRRYTRYYFSGGWSEFRRANDLCEGDKCVFKFLRSEGKFCLSKLTKRSHVFKRRSPPPPPCVVVEQPEGQVSKRSGGREVVVGLKVDGKAPAGEEEFKRKRGRPKCEEAVKRPRGRPFKKKRRGPR